MSYPAECNGTNHKTNNSMDVNANTIISTYYIVRKKESDPILNNNKYQKSNFPPEPIECQSKDGADVIQTNDLHEECTFSNTTINKASDLNKEIDISPQNYSIIPVVVSKNPEYAKSNLQITEMDSRLNGFQHSGQTTLDNINEEILQPIVDDNYQEWKTNSGLNKLADTVRKIVSSLSHKELEIESLKQTLHFCQHENRNLVDNYIKQNAKVTALLKVKDDHIKGLEENFNILKRHIENILFDLKSKECYNCIKQITHEKKPVNDYYNNNLRNQFSKEIINPIIKDKLFHKNTDDESNAVINNGKQDHINKDIQDHCICSVNEDANEKELIEFELNIDKNSQVDKSSSDSTQNREQKSYNSERIRYSSADTELISLKSENDSEVSIYMDDGIKSLPMEYETVESKDYPRYEQKNFKRMRYRKSNPLGNLTQKSLECKRDLDDSDSSMECEKNCKKMKCDTEELYFLSDCETIKSPQREKQFEEIIDGFEMTNSEEATSSVSNPIIKERITQLLMKMREGIDSYKSTIIE